MPNEMLASLSYISTARTNLEPSDFQNILNESNERNEKLGLTGLLAFNGFNFMQILEGSRESLNYCIALIDADPRHDGLVIFDRRDINRREFPDWQMAGVLVDPEGHDTKAQLAEFLSSEWVRPATRRHFESFHSFGTQVG